VKHISDIINRNLRINNQILNFLVHILLIQQAIKWPLKFPPYPTSVYALPGKNRTSKTGIEMNKNIYKFHLSGSVAPTVRSFTMSAVSSSSKCTMCRLVMLMNSTSD